MMMIALLALAFAPTPRTQAKALRPQLRPLMISTAESTSNGDSARDSPDAPLAVQSSEALKLPTVSRPFVVRLVACLCLFGVVSPHLASRVAYVAVGVSLGFGSTKFIRVAASPDARDRLAAFAAQLQVRARLRALLLRIDPSLADNEGNPITLRELGGPLFRGKKKQGRGIGPPPWAQAMNPTERPAVSVLEEQGRLAREDAEREMAERRVRSGGTRTASSSASAEAEAEAERERAIIEKKARERERLAEQARIAEAENLAWAVREAAWARERERALEAAAALEPFPPPPSQSMPEEQSRTEG